jgi:hypothetical protein
LSLISLPRTVYGNGSAVSSFVEYILKFLSALRNITVRSTYEVKTSSAVRTSTAHGQCTTERASFKNEASLSYTRTQCVPRNQQCPPLLYKKNLLMFHKAKVAVCPEIRTEHINEMWAPRRIF